MNMGRRLSPSASLRAVNTGRRGLRRGSVLDCGDERSESPLWLRFGEILIAHHAKAAIAQTPSPQSKTSRSFPGSLRISTYRSRREKAHLSIRRAPQLARKSESRYLDSYHEDCRVFGGNPERAEGPSLLRPGWPRSQRSALIFFAIAAWLLLFGFGIVSSRAQSASFIITNTQTSLPITAFTAAPFITNFPPGSPIILLKTITAPSGSGAHHFTHWTLNGQRMDDDTARAMNPVDFVFTNNVDAVAHYVPTGDYTGDSIVPDWFKIEYYGNTSNDAFSDTDGDGFDLKTEILRGYHPKLPDILVEGGLSRRRSETTLILVDTNLVSVTARSDPVGLYSDFKIVSKGNTFTIPAQPDAGGFIGWFVDSNRVDDAQGFSTGNLTLRLIDAAQATLYDNTANLLNKTFFPGNGIEFGDEIFLSGSNRVVTDFSFLTYLGGPTNGTERVELFLRSNGGPSGEPDSLLYRSGEIGLELGWVTISLGQLQVTVPGHFTWSVVLNGIGSLAHAGLGLADPPGVGESFGDFWAKQSDGSWGTYIVDGGATPGNFAASVVAASGAVVAGNDLVFVAKFFRGDTDSDGDGLENSYELFYFNSLTNNLDSDPDGDGFDIRTERLRGYHPNAIDQLAEGGISRRRSEIVLVLTDSNLARVTAISEPVGFYSDFKILTKVSTFSVPAQPSAGGFIGWFVGSERVDNAQGFSTGTLNFTITDDTVFVARFLVGEVDSDGDGLGDTYELFNFNSLSNNLDSDPDGDGFNIRTELLRAYHPQAFDELKEGGVSRRRSETSLFIPPPPEIVSQPEAANVIEGNSVTLTVQVRGIGQLTYQWRLNGVNLPGATSSTAVVSSVTITNSGAYSVAVASPFGAVNSDPAVVMVNAAELTLADNFANATLFTDLCRRGRASNLASSRELGEPQHHEKPGTNSVWLGWKAGANGVVNFSTAGSSFDTLLAVYAGNSLANLTPVAGDDDSGGFYTSAVTFNATNGVSYWIAVDGLRGASGQILLTWCLEATTLLTPSESSRFALASATGSTFAKSTLPPGSDFPQFTAQPASQTVAAGTTVPFQVHVVSRTPASYQWFFNGQPIPGATSEMFQVGNVTRTNVGNYYVAASVGSRTNRSDMATLQIGTKANAIVKDKTRDLYKLKSASGTGFEPMAISVSPGNPGAHTFNSHDSKIEAGEINVGGKIWSSSQWLILQAAGSGRLVVEARANLSNIGLGVDALSGNDFSILSEIGFDDDDDGRCLIDIPVTSGVYYLVGLGFEAESARDI